MARIWVVGSANIDLVSTVAALPSAGQTVHGSDLVTTFGGKGANQAVAAARLATAETSPVAFVGCVGSDDHGSAYLAHLNAEGIDTGHAARSTRPTGCALIVVDAAGANNIVVAPGANQDLRPEKLHFPVQSEDLVLLQFEVPMETNLRAVELARQAGARVMLNPSPATHCDALLDAGVDLMVLNEHEAEFFTGAPADDEAALKAALPRLRERVHEGVIVTRGGAPAWVLAEDELLEVPGRPVNPVDTVGAGDAFTGALAVALCEGRAWRDAMTFAHAAAARATLSLGAQAAMPRREELDLG
jgi:ribokinase